VSYSLPTTEAAVARQWQWSGHQCTAHPGDNTGVAWQWPLMTHLAIWCA